jgi:hypothetical protein
MASLGAALQLALSGGPMPLLVALLAMLTLHLLLRARAPARPRGPVTLTPGAKARASTRKLPRDAHRPRLVRRWSCSL